MKPKLIIFDFDGTLADTTSTILATFRAVFEELALPARTDAECRATIGLPLIDGFRQLYPDFTAEQIDGCVDAYHRIFEENRTKFMPGLYPGVKETLGELAQMGIEMSVASSRSKDTLDQICAANDISHFFTLILSEDDVEHAKPNPEPVLVTLSRLGRDAERTLVVGDMPVDIAMGAGAGCTTVGVSYGNSSRRELVNAGASYIIDAFPELLSRVIFEK